MSEKIIYPSIDLFLYDLKEGLGETEDQIEEKCKKFCKKLFKDQIDINSAEFQKIYAQIAQYRHADVDAIALLDTRKKDFENPLDGYYDPLQFGDTYALRVDYSGKLQSDGKTSNDDPKNLDTAFKDLKATIESHIAGETGTIGQTWLAWGKLPVGKTDHEIEEIAKTIYTQIVSNYQWDRDYIGKGSLAGATLFELWFSPPNPSQPWNEFWQQTYRPQSCHLLIWLFPETITADEMRAAARDNYYDFQRLFHYRHKIIWSYYQSRWHKTKLKPELVKLETTIAEVRHLPDKRYKRKIKLGKLQHTLTETLTTLSNYTIELDYLTDKSRTIETNLANYNYRLADTIAKNKNSDLAMLKQFGESELYAKKYQRQINTDIANFSSGLTVLQNLNQTISGIIQIEQTKSDRALNQTVAAVGAGLAASGVTATIISADKSVQTYKDLVFLQSPAFVLSLGIGAIAAFIFWLLARWFNR